MKSFINTIAALSCLLPLAVFAAPASEPTPADFNATIAARQSDDHAGFQDLPIKIIPLESCYSHGASFDSLGNADVIAKTVALGCGDYADDPNRIATFQIGQHISWCTNTVDGKGSINLGMTYRTDAAGTQNQFTPDPAAQQGGIAEYCWVGMTWARTQCGQGGTFYGHALDNGQGRHYWDFNVDPNSNRCGQ